MNVPGMIILMKHKRPLTVKSLLFNGINTFEINETVI